MSLRVYGTATFSTFSPVPQGSTTAGAGATFTTTFGRALLRDGFCQFNFRIVFTGLVGGVGNVQISLGPNMPLPIETVPVTISLQRNGVDIPQGANYLEGTISNINNVAVIELFNVASATSAATALAIPDPFAAIISGAGVYQFN